MVALFGVLSARPTPALAATNLLTNGGFETGTTSSWTQGGAGVDVVSGWQTAEGSYLLDLNASSPGSVSQSFTTSVGQQYTLSFAMAGNPSGCPTGDKTMTVTVAGVTQNYTFNNTGRTTSDMGWVAHLLDFTATGPSTTLTFESTGPNTACGPTIDNVAVLKLYKLTMLSGTGAAGTQDPYVNVSKDGGATWTHAYLATGHPWNEVSATDRWVTCDSNLFSGCLNQTVDYRVKFEVPAGYFRSKIDIGMMPDNFGSVYLNGTQIAPAGGGEFTGAPATAPYASGIINVDALLTPGINSLVFRVRDVGGAAGVNFVATVSSNVDSPMTVVDSTTEIAANSASVTVDEGQTPTNSGTYADDDPTDDVVLTASVGTVTKTGTNSGTWVWTGTAPDGPASYPVTIAAAHPGPSGPIGPSAQTTFTVTVNNVAPDLQISGANTVYYTNWTSADVGAGTASGVITFPDTSTINVGLSTSAGGFYGAQTSGGGTNYWIPSAPYISPQVPNAPPDSDIIELQGGTNTVYTVTFSQPIVDPIMAILSLGSTGNIITYNFNAPFTIVSQGAGYFSGGNVCPVSCLVQLPGNVLQGREGHGTIKFLGTYSSFSWTVPNSEIWHGFTFAVRSSQALAQTVIVNEGQTATNNGTWDDVPADKPSVSLTASAGNVVKNADGTWSWSYLTTDGPVQSGTVSITANDGDGGITQKSFPLVVNNVAPTVNAGPDATINEGQTFNNAPACPGTVTDPSTGHRYMAVAGAITWPSAKLAAEALTCGASTGHLATITSAAEQSFLNANLPAATFGPGFGYWIGGRWTGSAFTWVTGEAFGYTNWNLGEPNGDVDGAIHFFGLGSPIGTWNDASATVWNFPGYVVEFDGPFVPGTFTDPGQDSPWTGTVNYGDGTGIQPLTIDQVAKSFVLSHQYNDNGVYTVQACVKDKDLAQGCDTLVVTVNNVSPTATFGAPASVIETELVQLSLTGSFDPSSADTGAPLQYAFDCGSGYGPLSPANTGTCLAGEAPGPMTVKGKVQDKDGGFTEYTATVVVTVPTPPGFNVDASPVAGACICTPLIMNTENTGIEHWWVKADSSGTLTLTVTAHSVNATDPETVVARIFPVSGTPMLAMATASYGPGTPAGTEVDSLPVSIVTTPGTVYLVRVTTPGTPPTQPHYRLKFNGAVEAGIKSPTFRSIEPETPVRWYVNVGSGESLGMRIFGDGVPLPTVPGTATFGYQFDGDAAATVSALVTPGPFGGYSATVAPSSPTLAGKRVFTLLSDVFVPAPPEPPTPSGIHYRLETLGIGDAAVYLGPFSYGYGDIVGTVLTSGGAPFPGPVTVNLYDGPAGPWIGSTLTLAGTFSFSNRFVGTYRVEVVPPFGTNIVGPLSYVVVVTCDMDTPVSFTLNRPPVVTLIAPPSVDEGAAPFGLTTTVNDPDGNTVTFTWSLTGPGSLVPSGGTATYANADGPASADVKVVVDDGFGGTDDDTRTIATLNVAPVLGTGKIVVNNDEWTFSNYGFSQNPASATQFMRNVANYFTGGAPGNFLAYSTNFGLTQSSLAAAMTGAGHTWTVSTAVPFTVANLQAYDGVFVAGPVGAGPSQSVLIDYVNAGGNVYVAAGTGCCGGAAGEAAIWDTFLNAFGLDLAPVYNGIMGNPSPASVHPLLAGVTTLYFDNGNSVSVINPAIAQVLFTLNGQGMLAVAAIGSVSANSVTEGGVTTLNVAFSDPGVLDTHTVTVSWGDGSLPTVLNLPLGARSFSATHTYVDDGASPGNGTPSDNYTIGITVTDKDLASDTESTAITVQNVAPSGILMNAPVIDEDGMAMLTVSFVDPGILDVHTVVIDWGPGEGITTLTLPLGARSFIAGHQYLDDNPTVTPSDVYAIGVTVSDDDTGVGTAGTTVTVNNVAPSALALNSPVVDENGTAMLTGSFDDRGTLDTHTVVIDWGPGEGITTLTLPLGARSFSASHQYLDDNPTATPSDTYTVSVTVTDDDSGAVTGSTTVVVNNVAPSALVLNSPVINENGIATLAGSFDDPGTLDVHTVVISWGPGEGITTVTLPVGDRTFSASHQYLDDNPTGTPWDTYAIGVTVTDDDTGSVTGSTTVVVNNVAPVVDAGADLAGSEGVPVALTSSFTDVGTLDTHTATIGWGDTTSSVGVVGESGGSGSVSGSHVYADNGQYTVTVCVKDDDLATTCDTLIVDIGNVAPTVEAGGDQSATEGSVVSLDPATFNDLGTLDTHTATVDWGDGTGAQPAAVTESPYGPPGSTAGADGTVAGSHVYADNGQYTVTVCVTDDDLATTCDSFVVDVNNVAPTLEAGGDRTINEAGSVSLDPATFNDLGTLDTHSATIDWGDNVIEAGTVTESPYGPPGSTAGANGTVAGSHVYGDDGVFTVTVCVTDDDLASTCDSFAVTVNNLPPTVELDTTGSVALPSGQQVFLGRKGTAQSHTATANDPGSDDLTFTWNFGPVITYYNGEGPDPDPSPAGTFPFSVSNTSPVTFTAPGVYTIGVSVADDDGGVASDLLGKLVTDDCDCTKSMGYWKHQFDPKRKGGNLIPQATLQTYLDVIGNASAIFVGLTPEQAHEILNPKPVKNGNGNGSNNGSGSRDATTPGNGGKKKKEGGDDDSDDDSDGTVPKLARAKAQTLAAWLNFAKGAIGWDELVDTNGDKVGDRTFGSIIAEVELILSNPAATDADLEHAKDLAESVNLHDKRNPLCDTDSGSTGGIKDSSSHDSGSASSDGGHGGSDTGSGTKPSPKPDTKPGQQNGKSGGDHGHGQKGQQNGKSDGGKDDNKGKNDNGKKGKGK
jgi:choice-of-anchor C domain-containing protein